MATTYNTTNNNNTINSPPGTINGIPFARPYGIDPQDVPWLSDLIARQSLRLFDGRQLHDLSPSVAFGPNAAIHTAHLPLQPQSNQTTLVALKQHHRPADLISEVHLLLTTPASQFTNPILGIVQLGDQGFTYLVVPYHPLGNLRQYIADQRPNLKPLSQMQIIHDIASGLEYLHQRGIQHMNLHSANVLITMQGMAVLTDFGRPNNRAEVGMPPKPPEQERIRSLATVFLAPEVLASNQYSSQSEVYALGMVMFELLTGKVAFDKDLSQPGLSNRIMFGRKDDIPANIKGSPGTAYETLIKDCWELVPAKRPHLSQVKFRLEQLMDECSAAPPTPPLPELPPATNTIQPQKVVPELSLNVITTHIIVADTVRLDTSRLGTEGSSKSNSKLNQQDATSTAQPKPIEAWTIGQATISATAQRRDTIPISTRAPEISSTQQRVNQQTTPSSPDSVQSSTSPIALIPIPTLPLVSPTHHHPPPPITPSASSATGSDVGYNSSTTGPTWPLPPRVSSASRQGGHTPSPSTPALPTLTTSTPGPVSPSPRSAGVDDDADIVVRAYASVPRAAASPTHASVSTPIAARLREHERGHSFSSDDSGSRGPMSPNRTAVGAVMSPQEADSGASVTAGLTARAAYTPIASSEDVPMATPSNSIHAAAKNGDLPELQQFLNRALSRSLSNGSSSSTGNPNQTQRTGNGHGGRGSAAEILDEYEPIERLPVLCCAAVARKNKYQALNMVLKAGANVDGKEQRGGNTPLHLVCETALPPLADPSVTRLKQDELDDRARSRSEVNLHDPYLSHLTLPELVPADDDTEDEDSEEGQEKALKQVDEHDEQEQQALDRVKDDSESTFSLLTTDGGLQTLTTRQQSSLGGAYYQMKDQILVKGGLEDQIRLLVLAGSPIDTPNHRGETPLLLLLRFHDSVTALATLLKLGADPTVMAPFGPGTNPAEIHVDPKSLLSSADKKRMSKNLRSGGGPKLFGPKQGVIGQQPSALLSGLPSPLQTPYHQTMTNDDPNHILVMHGGALAHAAYYLRINCVRYLLDHEIECSDPAIIEQAIVACHHSVAAKVNPPLVATQNRILTILSRDWKGEAGRRRRGRVAERTLNKKTKAVRSNVLLVALAVSTSSPSSSSEPSSSPSARPIPTTHFYATEGPMGTEIELVSQYGFQADLTSAPVAIGGGGTRYQLTDRVVAPIPIPIKTSGLGYGEQQQQQPMYQQGQQNSAKEYQDWYGTSDPKSPRSGQSPGEGKKLFRKFKNIAGKRS
ncbi:hypothetical protein BGZ89_007235 [Linnemannia elongata]|nr:hypothetical protein BGZ89_007235 [Linnemannia elongata]